MSFIFPAAPGRVQIRLGIPAVKRALDVSRSPGVLRRSLLDLLGNDRLQDAEGFVVRCLDGFAASVGAWHEAEPLKGDITRTASGAAYPLLGAAYDSGAAAIGDIPTWAASALMQSRCADAARTLFGAKASRKVSTALARSLTPPENPALGPCLSSIFIALTGTEILEADQIAALLSSAVGSQALRTYPAASDLLAIRRLIAGMRRRDAVALLTDAAGAEDGVSRLVRCAQQARDFGSACPPHLPSKLRTLEERLRERYAEEIASAPDAAPTADGFREWSLPDLDWKEIGNDLRLRRLRGTSEIRAWGALMQNCLHSYVTAAVEGRIFLIGVEKQGRPSHCLELSTCRTIKQFKSQRNERVPDDDAFCVLMTLAEHGVVSLDTTANRAWMQSEGYSHLEFSRRPARVHTESVGNRAKSRTQRQAELEAVQALRRVGLVDED